MKWVKCLWPFTPENLFYLKVSSFASFWETSEEERGAGRIQTSWSQGMGSATVLQILFKKIWKMSNVSPFRETSLRTQYWETEMDKEREILKKANTSWSLKLSSMRSAEKWSNTTTNDVTVKLSSFFFTVGRLGRLQQEGSNVKTTSDWSQTVFHEYLMQLVINNPF